MTAKNSIGRTIWLVFLLLPCNVFLADATLRPGDQIERKLGGVPAADSTSISGAYTIDDSGAVKLPYVAQVKIAGLTSGLPRSSSETPLRDQKSMAAERLSARFGERLSKRVLPISRRRPCVP